MDTLDIMTLPGYEEDYTANPPSSSSVAYVPWEGPQGYIPGACTQGRASSTPWPFLAVWLRGTRS
jgi:hypothetical protein